MIFGYSLYCNHAHHHGCSRMTMSLRVYVCVVCVCAMCYITLGGMKQHISPPSYNHPSPTSCSGTQTMHESILFNVQCKHASISFPYHLRIYWHMGPGERVFAYGSSMNLLAIHRNKNLSVEEITAKAVHYYIVNFEKFQANISMLIDHQT